MMDHFKKSLLIAFLLCFLHNKSWSVISNDIDNLGESSKTLVKEEKPDLKNLKNKDDNVLDANFEVDDSAESLLAIEALLQSDLNEEKRNSVLIQKAMIELEQAYKKKKIKTEKKENIDAFFKKAKASVDQVIFNGKINQNKLAYAYFIKALVNSELEEYTEKKQNLEKSFKLGPSSKQSPQIAMALGEIYFEENNYKQAYDFFNIKYKELSPSQRIISEYKSAWCLLLQSKYDQAVNAFLKIIDKNEGSSLKNDAIRDLAYTMTLYKKENEMIQFASKNLKSQNQTDFLYFTLRYFYFSPKKEFKSLIFKNLLNQRLTPEKRIAILSLYLNFKRDIYPNLNYKVALNFTMKNLSENSIYPESQLFQTSAKEIESINEFFIKQYLDVILKKLPNKANLSKDQLLDEMLFHIKFHLSTFPQSSFKYQLIKLGIDAETETKNGNLFFFRELLEKEKVISDEAKSLLCKIDYELLQTKLKEKATTNEVLENHIESINKLLEKRAKPQECKFLSSTDEVFLKDKLFQFYFSVKDYQNAAKTIDEIYQTNKTENILYNRYLTYFNLGMFERITNEVETHKKVTKPEIKKIIRESFLKLAQGAGSQKENFNFLTYESNILSFIKTSDDKTKITSAYLDYFEKIQNNKDSGYLAKVWQGLSSPEKNNTQFISYREKLINKLLLSKEFDKVNLFIDPVNSEYLNFLYFFNKQQNKNYEIDFNSNSFQKLSNAYKNYFIQLNAITAPQSVNKWLKTKKSLSSNEEQLFWLTFKLIQNTEDPTIEESLQVKMRTIKFENHFKNKFLENSLLKFDFTKSNLSFDSYNKKAEQLIKLSSSVRQEISKSISKYSLNQRVEIFKKAEIAERGTYQFIIESPAPKEMTPAEVQDYRKQINELAQDYLKKADEYKALSEKLEQEVKQEVKNKDLNKPPRLKSLEWLTSTKEIADFSLSEIHNSMGLRFAISYLDFLKLQGRIDETLFWKMKIYLYLKSDPKQTVLTRLLWQDLKINKQTSLIDIWIKNSDN